MSKPGCESPEVMARCKEAYKRVHDYAEKQKLPTYKTDGGAWPSPIIMLLDAVIRENKELKEQLEDLFR